MLSIWLPCRSTGYSRCFLPRAQAVSDTAREHVARGPGAGPAGGDLGYWHVCGSVEHRNAVRVHYCVGRGGSSAKDAAGTRACVPGAAVTGDAGDFCSFLPLGLMLGLPLEAWIRFFVWLGIGVVLYSLYGRRRSPLLRGEHVTRVARLPGVL